VRESSSVIAGVKKNDLARSCLRTGAGAILLVLIDWAWDYFIYERTVRLIFPSNTPVISGTENGHAESEPVSNERVGILKGYEKEAMSNLQQDTSLHPVILFDGNCNLCNWFVRFVLGQDRNETFRFGTFQSQTAKELLNRIRIPAIYSRGTTVLLITDKSVETKSDAVLKILKTLGGAWTLLYLFAIVPKPIRDGIYFLVSRYRYHFFCKRRSCLTATVAELNRFI
jgi:predicted DCC family thiol-disulfide oxidoreductase YuxK